MPRRNRALHCRIGFALRLFSALILTPLLLPSIASAGAIAPPAIDAELAGLVADVSQDSLLSYIMTLQGFYTRHTNSDTVSSTVGIGAARRWVYDRFVDISNANGGNLQVAFHSFNATIQSISGVHRNVVATLPGTDPSAAERIFVISGHLDSRSTDVADDTTFAAGANDDGSGVGAVLEAARVLAQSSHEATIKFVAFTGEEQGLFGSAAYATDLAVAGANVEANLNNDIIGSVVEGDVDIGDSLGFDSTHVRLFSDGPPTSGSREMTRLFKVCAEAYQSGTEVILVPLQDRPGRGGDHISFNNAGYTATRLTDVYDNLIHQHAPGDTFQVMNFPYYRRNVQMNVANLGNIARAPRPVSGVAAGDVGDSTGFAVTWTPNPEADLAGYRVTTRSVDSLHYETAVDLGLVLSHAITPATAESLYIGVAAYDTEGHLGMATEKLARLSSVPVAPLGIEATPDDAMITVSWGVSPEQDLAGYNLYRATSSGGPYTLQNGSLLTSPGFVDGLVSAEQFYFYKATAVDSTGNESPQSGAARARIVSLSKPLLFVHETATPGGQPHLPTVAEAEAAYMAALQDFSYDVVKYDSAAAADGITLSDLGAYAAVIWASDDRNSALQGMPILNKHLKQNISTLSDYMDFGGQVLVIGWKEVSGFDEEYPVTFGAGDFLYDYFRAESVSIPSEREFWGATGVGGYPPVVVDTSKTRPAWSGVLPTVEYLTAVAAGGETAYTYNAVSTDSVFNDAPVGIRYDSGLFRTQFFDFPLYHLREADARALVGAAMAYFDVGTGVGDAQDTATLPGRIVLSSTPNPTRGRETVFSYSIPRESKVELVIYSPSGARVRVVEKALQPAGRYSVIWDGRDNSGHEVASGVYLYRLTAGELQAKRKLVIMR